MKIAVLRANALGDFIFILPALQALRKKFPNAEIVLLGKSLHKKFLLNRPSPIDRVVVIPPYPGVGEAEDYVPNSILVDDFFNQMQEEHFDVAIQMHGGGRNSNPFVLRLEAKLTIGSKTPDAPDLDVTIPYTTYFSEILRYVEMVSYLDARTTNLTPHISVTANDIDEAEQVIQNPEGKPLVVIQPGASDSRRCWPAEKFATVADALVEDGFFICFNGSEQEASLVNVIQSLMVYPDKTQNLSHLSLSGLVGLLSRASLMISNDTGPLHLAHALKTPAVGIYWAPNMVTGTPMTLMHCRPLISWNTTCPLCGASFVSMKNKTVAVGSEPIKECTHNVSFVADVTIEEVLNAARELLQANVEIRNVV